ncbi:hypothetical protein Droror1_Dr00008105 [Drosera rotundifolia]
MDVSSSRLWPHYGFFGLLVGDSRKSCSLNLKANKGTSKIPIMSRLFANLVTLRRQRSKMSYAVNSSNLNRQPSYNSPVLDEYQIYFSTLWSPPRKQASNHRQPNNMEARSSSGPAAHGTNLDLQDVDKEAEEFIKNKHRIFELSKWTSFNKRK